MKERALQLLESIMAGYDMKPDDLKMLLSERVSENLHLEYKHGDELKKADASKTIRDYVSGFANADGGILIIGVDDKRWRVTGCLAPGGSDLAEWATRCLNPVASYFSPPPRFGWVDHPKGKVLWVASYRSLNLVPCSEAGRPVYYFRFHDQTLSAPDYLISDLVLGRRQHPSLRLQKAELRSCKDTIDAGNNRIFEFRVGFVVENGGLSVAERVSLGIVSWVWGVGFVERGALVGSSSGSRVSDHLLSFVEVQEVDTARFTKQHSIVHLRESLNEIDPFTVKFPIVAGHMQIPILSRSCVPYTMEAAVYMISKGSPPVWYQLNLHVDFDSTEKMTKNDVSNQAPFVTIVPSIGTRPRVAWSTK